MRSPFGTVRTAFLPTCPVAILFGNMAAKKWDKERVLEALRADQRAGHDLSSAEMGRRHNGLYQACSNQFGSYAAALKALGIDPESVRKVRRWSAEKVVREIRRRYRAAEP